MKDKLIISTAAMAAAVFLCSAGAQARVLVPEAGSLPEYSKAYDKTVYDGDITVEQYGRRLTVSKGGEVLWELPKTVYSQDFFIYDIDRNGNDDLAVLCWKRGRFGKSRPFWIKEDEKTWSQHIFIYEIRGDALRPRWMASDIGISAASFDHTDGVIHITDTDGNVTDWIWGSWGLEKI